MIAHPLLHCRLQSACDQRRGSGWLGRTTSYTLVSTFINFVTLNICHMHHKMTCEQILRKVVITSAVIADTRLACTCTSNTMCPFLFSQHSTVRHSTARYGTAQHSTAQHSTAQHSTAQHSTAQHSTAQHSPAQHSTYHGSTSANTLGLSKGMHGLGVPSPLPCHTHVLPHCLHVTRAKFLG